MSYNMTTIYSNTKIREDHNTAARILTSVGAKVVLLGSEIWTAPADGVEVKKGDIWMKVTYNGVTGWMAYLHKGQFICSDFKEITVIQPPAAYEIPPYVDWTTPDGVTTRYYKQ